METQDEIERVRENVEQDPSEIDVDRAVALLERDHLEARQTGAEALHAVSVERPIRLRSALPALAAALTDVSPDVRSSSLDAVANVVEAHPDLADRAVPAIADVDVEEASDTVRKDLLLAVLTVARENPDAAADAVSLVQAQIDADVQDIRRIAVAVMAELAESRPDAALDAVDQLLEVLARTEEFSYGGLEDGDIDEQVGLDPHSSDREIKQRLQTRVHRNRDEVETYEILLRDHAASSLAAVANEYPEETAAVLADDIERYRSLLEDPNAIVRGAVVGLLSHVAETDPDLVRPSREAVAELLDDDYPFVRGNAIWTLAHLGDEAGREALERRREVESDEELRQTIDAALDTFDDAETT